MNASTTALSVAAPSGALLVFSWIARVIAAIILLQTLFFKFTGASESVYIFQTVGMEPFGRYASGVAELIAAVLLLIPATAAIGAAFAIGVMTGAIFFHLTKLGIVVQNDGGLLFALAMTVLACSAFVLVAHRHTLPIIGSRLLHRQR